MNNEARRIATNLNVSDRIEYISPRQSFIALKNHKANFNRNPKCELINPAKTEIGIISKCILDSILNKLSREFDLQMWGNSKF